ncbi:hypothetical protein [Mucilaginibacter segetis]|uniref:DUF3999 domain-containing protein n=1 Tax=Mucilaginibacter segetis TaxID=2793071 RepID=A0A934PWA2_9SPHI|nr:hypothetical protein [Mucilaginibacter segetis]MBK0380702.1 hypothetical protein [Mucilaginibacter segetis]
MNKLLLTLVIVLNSINVVFAQHTFKYRAVLPKPDTAGFYQINLPPAVIAKSKYDLSDLRILDGQGKFVPYVFGDLLKRNYRDSFISFPQIVPASQPDTVTTYIAENKLRSTINGLILKMRNTSVQRMVSVLGSDDMTRWYAITEDAQLGSAVPGNNADGNYEQLLNFPASTYHYFKIQVNNRQKAPVAILEAGIYKLQQVNPEYTALKGLTFTQKDSGNISSVHIRLSNAYTINKIHFDIAVTKFFKRAIAIYAVENQNRTFLGDTVISSAGGNDLYFSARAKQIELEIQNEDNPPLAFENITAYQLNQSLVAYLNKADTYQLLFGDSTAMKPFYDLGYFADSLHLQIPLLTTGKITPNPLYQRKIADSEQHVPKWLIWAAILIVVTILAVLTYKLTKEIGKRE